MMAVMPAVEGSVAHALQLAPASSRSNVSVLWPAVVLRYQLYRCATV